MVAWCKGLSDCVFNNTWIKACTYGTVRLDNERVLTIPDPRLILTHASWHQVIHIKVVFTASTSNNDSLTRHTCSNKHNQNSRIRSRGRQNLMRTKLSEQSYQRGENHQGHTRRDQTRDFPRHVRHNQHRNHEQQASACRHDEARQSLLVPNIPICLVATDIAKLWIGVVFGKRQLTAGKDMVRYEPARLENPALESVCRPHEERVLLVTTQSALLHEVEIADGITLRTAVSGFRSCSQQAMESLVTHYTCSAERKVAGALRVLQQIPSFRTCLLRSEKCRVAAGVMPGSGGCRD